MRIIVTIAIITIVRNNSDPISLLQNEMNIFLSEKNFIKNLFFDKNLVGKVYCTKEEGRFIAKILKRISLCRKEFTIKRCLR